MHPLNSAILAAWEGVKRKIKDDPAELTRRLARRRLKAMTRPPRAWCLAVRASDARIHSGNALIVPEDAAYLGRPDLFRPHRVTLEARVLRKLCRAVEISPPGESWREVARKLGVDGNTLRRAMARGVFQIRHLWHYQGASGRPVPVLYTDQPLD